jgi:putative ABC transport system permease protein
VQTLALAGGLFTVGVAAAVGVYWVRRRRTEMRQLASRGVTATSIGARTLLEAAVPVALGAAASWLVVNWVVPLIGPSDLIDTSAKRSAVAALRVGAILGLVVIAISVAWGARREAIQAGGKLLRTAARLPWELLILALAGAALYEIVTRGTTLVSSGGGPPRIDKLLILFPILFMLGSAGLLVRGIGFALGKVRRRGRGLYVSTFLAFRRLAGATRTGLALLSLTAVSTGLLVYAGALAASAANVIDQKSQAYVGSETSVVMGGAEPAIPASFPFPATLVTRIEPIGTLYPVGSSVEILGVDPETFPGAAYWAPSFSDAHLQDLLGRLRGSTTHGLPALVLARGEVPSPPVLRAGSALIPFRAVGDLRSFPGVQTAYSVLVVDRQVASSFLEQSEASRLLLPQHVELWARGDAGAVQAALRAAGASYTHVVTAQAIRSLPAFLALSWTFGFMRFIGAVVGLISLVGVVLYLQARQRTEELSYALVARMGLSPGAHRRSLALELCVLLELAFLIGGALAVLAARLTFSRLDPIPSLPPSISLSVPLLFLTGAAVGLLVAGLIGAAQAQWQANRATPAEVIRLAA